MEINKSASHYRNNHSFAYIATAISLLIIITSLFQILPESLTIFAVPIILVIITLYIGLIAYQFQKLQEKRFISELVSEN
ncbi:hypothetical protein NEF87_002128 [Candidatus Lokiarchaeum ossiferum]|uniref:Uncharacterized protein n=1 Tax=Candidatus Lokiarchaeum ossiferum TaxID=2951803 RepID=A0ABY6HR79_9ARCH|nr:hypothetical protein NEF87_002128 [Candidatus Lokiarchaeum sp. B-35]